MQLFFRICTACGLCIQHCVHFFVLICKFCFPVELFVSCHRSISTLWYSRYSSPTHVGRYFLSVTCLSRTWKNSFAVDVLVLGIPGRPFARRLWFSSISLVGPPPPSPKPKLQSTSSFRYFWLYRAHAPFIWLGLIYPL